MNKYIKFIHTSTHHRHWVADWLVGWLFRIKAKHLFNKKEKFIKLPQHWLVFILVTAYRELKIIFRTQSGPDASVFGCRLFSMKIFGILFSLFFKFRFCFYFDNWRETISIFLISFNIFPFVFFFYFNFYASIFVYMLIACIFVWKIQTMDHSQNWLTNMDLAYTPTKTLFQIVVRWIRFCFSGPVKYFANLMFMM